MSSLKYVNFYVAYIDILGFRNITKDIKWNPAKIYSVLKMVGKDVPKPINRVSIEDIHYENIRSYIMSDSIVYYIDSSTKNAFMTLTYFCSILLGTTLMNMDPVLCRGAIVKGDLFRDEDILFGPALTDAYELEKTISIYPRIIIDEKITENLKEVLSNSGEPYEYSKSIYDGFIYKDYDGIDCIEFPTAYTEYQDDQYNKLLDFLKEKTNSIKDVKIKAKWKYVLNRHMTKR